MTGRIREWLPFLLCVVWFGLFLSQNLSVAHDSMAYLLHAATGHDLWHANHLLTLPLTALFINAGAALKLPLPAMELATIPNILCGALAIQVVFLFLRRRLNLGYADALLGSLLPAVSFGIWYYSVTIEAYAVPVCLMLLCVYLLADENRTERTFLIVAVIHSIAALFHQFAVLIGPLVIYSLWAAPAIAGRRKIPLFAAYVAITAILVGGTYIGIGVAVYDVRSPGDFLVWLVGNAAAEDTAQFVGGFELKTLLMACVGFGRSLISGHFAFAVPELNDLLAKAFGAQSLDDERFLVQDLSPMMARTLLAMSLLWGLLLFTALVRSLSCFRDIRHTPPVVMVLWAFVPMTLLFTFYFGHNLELWLMQSVCFWIVIAWALARLQARRTQLSLLIGLLLINLFGSMQFVGNPDRDFNHWRLQPIVEASEPGDLIVIGDWWPTAHFVRYFTRSEPLILSRSFQGKTDVASLTRQVTERLAAGAKVFVYDDIYNVDPSSASYYGADYVEYAKQFRNSLPSADTLSTTPGRQHRLIRRN